MKNARMRTPIQNDHFGFEYGDTDFQGRLHPGVDLNGPGGGNADLGTPVFAIAPGVVTFVSKGSNGGWGNLVYVKHDMVQYFLSFGLDRPEWCPDAVWSQYAHLHDINVVTGQEVDTETVIGPLGGTGGWSAHLHHEIRKQPLWVYYYPNKGVDRHQLDEMYFDPMKFVAGVNEYITLALTQSPELPTSRFIKGEKTPEVYAYNGETRHHIPNEQTALFHYGPDWAHEIEVVPAKVLKKIPEGEPMINIFKDYE